MIGNIREKLWVCRLWRNDTVQWEQTRFSTDGTSIGRSVAEVQCMRAEMNRSSLLAQWR